MKTRINARIDEALAGQIAQRCRHLGLTLTQAIEEALVIWAREKRENPSSPSEIFASNGFVGSGKGPKDLARNAKRYLGKSLEKKV